MRYLCAGYERILPNKGGDDDIKAINAYWGM